MSNIARFKEVRIRDREYLDSFRDRACEACGIEDGTIVAAHVRAGHEGGTGYKPSDDLTVALCFACHQRQESEPGPEWWFKNVFKVWLRKKYQEWKYD